MTTEPSSRAASRLGVHRVLEPRGVLPQPAWKLDNTPAAFDNEILCSVEVLNIDSASFRQIAETCTHDPHAIAQHIKNTVAARGKQHNPVTGSGGMFIGTVAAIGTALAPHVDLAVGDRIASLVSLSLTPLHVESIDRVDVATGRVWARGHAVLFESGLYAKLPSDIDENVALAVLDVAGAPAQVARMAKEGDTVLVIGADGKSGILSCAVAKAKVGPKGRVIAIAPSRTSAGARLLTENDFVDTFIELDARDALAVLAAVSYDVPGLADLTINCVNVPGTELSSILATRDRGTVYFFSMSTSFTAAALGAEGVGKDVTMIVGNGYAKDHAETALQTLRDEPKILEYFNSKYRGAPA